MIDLSEVKKIADKYSEPWNKLISDLLKDLVIGFNSGVEYCKVDLFKYYGGGTLACRYVKFGVKKKNRFVFVLGDMESVNQENGFLAFLKSQLAEILHISPDSFSLTYGDGMWLIFEKL